MLRADGTYAGASSAALEMLGVSLDELIASKPGRFSAEPADERATSAFREQWEGSGQPDVGGTGTLRRADGQLIRVTFLITRQPDGGFVAMMRPAESKDTPTRLFALGDVLSSWRAAERRLAGIAADDPDWTAVVDEVSVLREQYHHLFESRRRGGPDR